MDIIHNNPFRVIGVSSNVKLRELERQKNLLTSYISINRVINTKYDFPFLKVCERNDRTVRGALSAIELSNDKLFNALFWFSDSNPFDKAAIDHLSTGDKAKALSIWQKVINEKEISEKNVSCFNNLGTLLLLSDVISDQRMGVELKIRLIESASFQDFSKIVTDAVFLPNLEIIIPKFLVIICNNFKQIHSQKEVFELFENCSSSVQKQAAKKLTEESIEKIEQLTATTKNRRVNSFLVSAELGLDLYRNCKNEINTLKTILGKNDLSYQTVADKLSKEILQCGIAYYKDNEDEESCVDQAISILEKAKLICVNQSTRDRIEGNIDELNDVKYGEIIFTIETLKLIKTAIKNLENENKGKSFLDRKIINRQKVDEILAKEVTVIRIKKIIDSKNSRYINEFIELVAFIRDNLSSEGIKKIIKSLIRLLPANHEFAVSEKNKLKKAEEEERKRKAEEDARRKSETERADERRRQEAVRAAQRKKQEAEDNQRQWAILLGIIGAILIIAGAIWGWDGVIGVIIIAVLILLNSI
jgi:hypothetical protein